MYHRSEEKIAFVMQSAAACASDHMNVEPDRNTIAFTAKAVRGIHLIELNTLRQSVEGAEAETSPVPSSMFFVQQQPFKAIWQASQLKLCTAIPAGISELQDSVSPLCSKSIC